MAQPIKVKLDLDKLRIINGELANITYEPTNKRHENIQRSILQVLGKRLQKKQIDVYPSNREFSFKMAYFEADILEEVLRVSMENDLLGSPTWHTLRMIADEINQKLA